MTGVAAESLRATRRRRINPHLRTESASHLPRMPPSSSSFGNGTAPLELNLAIPEDSPFAKPAEQASAGSPSQAPAQRSHFHSASRSVPRRRRPATARSRPSI